ncbi:MAG: 5-(carboxyamino)imidazole ribonucleotide synthase [Flavobacteriaceae bacterium]|nr:5-(carboxyamino)imidazole ribonucleotide synthase [Flavobacteriaceae bacterium]
MQYSSSSFKLGILGGGQLGKMMTVHTRKMDIHTLILDPSESAPARLSCNTFFQGDLLDYDTVYEFGKKVNVLTIEIENVNVAALEQLEREGIKVYPKPKSLNVIRNKVRQKTFYKQHQLPTAPFQKFTDKDDLVKNTPPLPFVWKSAEFGYDGKGVQVVKSEHDIAQIPNGPCLAEQLIDFEKEIAVIVARSSQGEVKTYPLVAMDFHPTANLVEYVVSPAPLDKSIHQKAEQLALEVAEKMDIVGLLAVEMFLTKSGDILINEVAPRPHNSGHQTIESNYTDQFEQHIRAVLDLPLGSSASKCCGIMINLIGEAKHNGPVIYQGLKEALAIEGVYAHVYGKAETRPFRKMGHMTIVDANLEKAYQKAKQIKSMIKVISV